MDKDAFKNKVCMQILKTDRLLLRALTPEIYKEVFSTYNDDELMRFFGCRSVAELDEERKKNEAGLSMFRKSLLIFQLIEKESGEVIGWCGNHTWYLPHFRARADNYIQTSPLAANSSKYFLYGHWYADQR